MTPASTTTRTGATTILYGTLASPIGRLAVAWRADDGVVIAVHMAHADHPGDWDTAYRDGGPVAHLRETMHARLAGATLAHAERGAPLEALARYFEGDLGAIDGLDTDPGGTPLQSAVWARLRTIPAGTTMTYGELARAVGRPRASRAAGRAVGTNPIPIIVPCHRIVGANGTLTGFGGGLPRKRWLLKHEGALSVLL